MKKVFRIIGMLLIVTILCCTFFACDKDPANEFKFQVITSEQKLPHIELSEEEKTEIFNLYATWAETEHGENYPHKDEKHFFYYGEYQGFDIVKFCRVQTIYGQYYDEYIGGLDFAHPGEGKIYAVGKDVCGTLKGIYEEGYLTHAQLEEIHKTHVAIFFDTYYSVGNPEITLEEYKEIIKNEISAYAEGKGQENFAEEEWAKICEIVSVCNERIESETSKSTIYKLRIIAEALIEDTVAPLDMWGVPISDEERTEVLKLYSAMQKDIYGRCFAYDDNTKFYYYGRFNGFYILLFPSGWAFASSGEHIEGLDFSRGSYNSIYAIKNGACGELKDVYEQGYLTRRELEEIYRIHVAIFKFGLSGLQNAYK